jgi:hypothetical protein
VSEEVKAVAIHRLTDRFLIEVEDRTTAGFWLSSQDMTVLPLEASDSRLGEAVQDSLSRSRCDIPAPPRDEPPSRRTEALVAASGRRSYRSYVRGTRQVTVQQDRAGYRVETWANGGPTGPVRGFRPIGEPLMLPTTAGPNDIGRTVVAALEVATPWPVS